MPGENTGIYSSSQDFIGIKAKESGRTIQLQGQKKNEILSLPGPSRMTMAGSSRVPVIVVC